MEFRKFNSLENSYQQRFIGAAKEQVVGGPWIVTEKLDGANFAFYYNGEELKVASRTQFTDGTFYACQDVIDEVGPLIIDLYEDVFGYGTLIIYGELVGPRVQGRVNYGQGRQFFAFEVVHLGEDHPESPIAPKGIGHDFCAMFGIPYVPVIAVVDTLDEALAISNTFRSNLTPEDFEGDNFAEGVVIEPFEPSFLRNGKRVCIKNKSESFSEVRPKQARVEVPLPASVVDVLNDLLPYITESRVRSVVSKRDALTQKDFGVVLNETIVDALADFQRDTERNPAAEANEDFQGLMKELRKAATAAVRPVFLEAIQ